MIVSLKKELNEARAEGFERMRELCGTLDPYELHVEGAPFARIIDSPASLIRIMQDAILSMPNPYAENIAPTQE